MIGMKAGSAKQSAGYCDVDHIMLTSLFCRYCSDI